MSDYSRKRDDEMLVVHVPRPPADRAGREPVAHAAEALPADVQRLAARLGATASADERTRLLGAIQNRFGNAFAAQVVEAFERQGSGAPDGPPQGGSGNEDR